VKRKFEIITFNPKTKEIEGVSIYTTRQNLPDDDLKVMIKEKLKKTFYKHSAWRIVK
jgi:hypothetical protein